MLALWCNQFHVQKQVRLLATNALMVRTNTIPLRALTSNWDPSLRTYVCPFLMCRMRYSFSVNLRTERKWVPDNARTGTKVTKTGHFFQIAHMGRVKKRIQGSQCAKKSCAHIVYNIYIRWNCNPVWRGSWHHSCHSCCGMVSTQLLPRFNQISPCPWLWWSKDASIWPSTALEGA